MQIARAFGASQIIAVDVRDDKLEKAKTFGATHTVNAAQEDPIGKIIVCAFPLTHFVKILLCQAEGVPLHYLFETLRRHGFCFLFFV